MNVIVDSLNRYHLQFMSLFASLSRHILFADIAPSTDLSTSKTVLYSIWGDNLICINNTVYWDVLCTYDLLTVLFF